MPDCPTCGLPYAEGDKFCPQCGGKLPAKAKTLTCKMCGNTLNEHAQFCNICGTPTGVNKEEQKPKEDLSNPTMDEIQIPVITDDTPALQEKPLKDANTPTMDSIFMPGQQPAPQQSAPQPAPVITPEEKAMANRTVDIAPTPVINDTPVVNDMGNTSSMYDQYSQNQNMGAGETTVLTPEGRETVSQQSGNITPEGQMPVGGNAIPNQIPNGMNGGNGPRAVKRGEVVPGKGAGALVPIILVILIIGVILFDVFFLFKDQIFGKDGEKTNSGCYTISAVNMEYDAENTGVSFQQ